MAQEAEPRWIQPGISRHQSSRLSSAFSAAGTPHSAAGHTNGLRTDGTWVTHPEMLCMTLYTLSVLPSMPEHGYKAPPLQLGLDLGVVAT